MNLMYDKRPESGKFVAVYSDGGGASVFAFKDGVIVDAQGVETDEEGLDSYLYWFALPDGFKLWFEHK